MRIDAAVNALEWRDLLDLLLGDGHRGTAKSLDDPPRQRVCILFRRNSRICARELFDKLRPLGAQFISLALLTQP